MSTTRFTLKVDKVIVFISEDLKATQRGLISTLDATGFLGADCVYAVVIEAKDGAGQANSTGEMITIGRVVGSSWSMCLLWNYYLRNNTSIGRCPVFSGRIEHILFLQPHSLSELLGSGN